MKIPLKVVIPLCLVFIGGVIIGVLILRKEQSPIIDTQTFKKPAPKAIYSEELEQSVLQELASQRSFNANGFLARISLDSPKDLEKAFLRANMLFSEGKIGPEDKPISFVIHGPEVQIFFKENYNEYKSIVDLAAKLSAFNVVEVNVCKTRMGLFDENIDALPPFVGTVPFGPAEVERLLMEEQYVYF